MSKEDTRRPTKLDYIFVYHIESLEIYGHEIRSGMRIHRFIDSDNNLITVVWVSHGAGGERRRKRKNGQTTRPSRINHEHSLTHSCESKLKEVTEPKKPAKQKTKNQKPERKETAETEKQNLEDEYANP